MQHPLDYRTPPSHPADHRLGRLVWLLAVVAGVCFALPFGLLHMAGWLYPGKEQEAVAMLLVPMLMLWLASGLAALAGSIAGAMALWRGDARASTIAATAVSGLVLLVGAVHTARGIIQSLQHG